MPEKDIEKLLNRAREAAERRNFELALTFYANALEISPGDLETRIAFRMVQDRAARANGASTVGAVIPLVKAAVLTTIGRQEAAIIAAEKALTAQPAFVPAMKLFANAAEKAGHRDLAAWQRQVLADKFAPEDTGNLMALGKLYEALGRGSEAVACYEQIKQIKPTADVDPLIRNASAIITTDTFHEGFKKGARTITKDEREAAILEITDGRAKDDTQRQAVIDHLLETELPERPEDHRIWIQVGDYYAEMEDLATGYPKAKESYLKAAEMVPSDSTPRMKLGDLELSRFRRRLRAIRARLKEDSADEEARAEQKKLLKEMVAFGIDEYERRVKEQPTNAEFHFELGRFYFQDGRFEDAIGEFQQAAKSPKYRINALNLLGQSFHNTGQYDLAISQYRRAQEGEEVFQKIRDSLYLEGKSLEARGDADSLVRAKEIYTRIYEDDVNFRDIRERVRAVDQAIQARGSGEGSSPEKA